YIHGRAIRHFPGPRRPDSPRHRPGPAEGRAAGQRHRRAGGHPPIRRLPSSAHPPANRLRCDAAGWATAFLFPPPGTFPRAGRLARAVPRPVGGAPRPPGRRARRRAEGSQVQTQGATRMNDTDRSKTIVERTYRAHPKELWDLWTTKEGFESWWGPE